MVTEVVALVKGLGELLALELLEVGQPGAVLVDEVVEVAEQLARSPYDAPRSFTARSDRIVVAGVGEPIHSARTRSPALVTV